MLENEIEILKEALPESLHGDPDIEEAGSIVVERRDAEIESDAVAMHFGPRTLALSEPDKNLKQDLVIGLIYPAVLGSIFYTALGEITKQVSALWASVSAGAAYNFSFVLTVKFALVFIAIVFYFCDYLYIIFTNDYRDDFFLYDLIFVVTMYLAFTSIGLDGGDRPPSAKTMLLLYLCFMFFYYQWDKSELDQSSGDQADLFKKVVRWEILSIAGILLCLAIILCLEYVWPGKIALCPGVPGLLAAGAMTAVTFYFARYAGAKKKFSLRYPGKR